MVIDTPPALHISDARVIGRLADAVVLVVRAGKTTRDAALMVKQRFGEDGTPVLGTILERLGRQTRCLRIQASVLQRQRRILLCAAGVGRSG